MTTVVCSKILDVLRESAEWGEHPRARVLRRSIVGDGIRLQVSRDSVSGCRDQASTRQNYDYCCEGYSMTVVYDKFPLACSILSTFAIRNNCCGQLARFFCNTCRKACCEACHLRHNGHDTKVLRCPCPQPSLEDGGSEAFLSCNNCLQTYCIHCVRRYVGMLTLEKVPVDWSDGTVIEALENVFNCKVTKYDRFLVERRMLVEFETQVIRIGTQCVKLEDGKGARIYIKPPHAAPVSCTSVTS